ncbi:2-iminoacetate synthase ThiH [Ruficoccus amylovorans]|uniref:2-iminoacetate synthase ThiH n=1 Tax=Ruficoccus amylovorans TaxID=1804625 RepID=A0A842HAY5_9BACT|nr:2-iminoacetate synthase ThiH [Ruficoccus amylovorans]MBC2593582.1 2-iminoacetate synthase ThiH [Ruficoccus amylovorans]
MARPAKYHTPAEAPAGRFSESLQRLPISELAYRSRHGDRDRIAALLRKGRAETLEDFALLTSPEAGEYLEEMAAVSQRLTQRFFGKAIRLFAPLYLSNECVNVCTYCGFSRNNDIPRLTIPVEVAEEQIAKIARQGFRSLLLVAGEHPKYVSNGYVGECIQAGLRHMPSVALELGPMDAADYAPLVQAGAEGLIVYQESYHQSTYESMHKAGPKKYFAWRMDTAERGYEAGFRRLGIGALYGLYDWRHETMAVAAHARHLLKHCWKAQISVSFPRMRPAAGGYQPDPSFIMSDREMVQVICALRMFLPQVGITLSTRERPELRDGLVKLGVTLMSAGSSTEPGGYEHFDEDTWTPEADQPGEQFHIADERPPVEIAAMIRRQGYEAVWKDFDRALVGTDTST